MLFIIKMVSISTDAVVGIQNSGGLRADIPKGEITVGDVIRTYPFNDELIEMDLTGKDLILRTALCRFLRMKK